MSLDSEYRFLSDRNFFYLTGIERENMILVLRKGWRYSDILILCKNIESYSCPRKIFVMDALPRTKMEKIDFVALSDKLPQ